MLLAPAPSLAFVIGLPVALMIAAGVVGAAAWLVLGRISRT